MDESLLPDSLINQIIFRELGFDEFDLDAEKDHTGRFQSWRVLPNHPKRRDAAAFMAALGYDVTETMCWVKTTKRGNCEVILPADHKDTGRLFILERPADLRIYNHADEADGGLTGQQWMNTSLFKKLAENGEWDGVLIDDIHQSKLLGQFSHRSIGLFAPALKRLRYHIIPIVHFDPWDCWKRRDDSTTPEFDALWASCQAQVPLAA